MSQPIEQMAVGNSSARDSPRSGRWHKARGERSEPREQAFADTLESGQADVGFLTKILPGHSGYAHISATLIPIRFNWTSDILPCVPPLRGLNNYLAHIFPLWAWSFLPPPSPRRRPP